MRNLPSFYRYETAFVIIICPFNAITNSSEDLFPQFRPCVFHFVDIQRDSFVTDLIWVQLNMAYCVLFSPHNILSTVYILTSM